MARNELHCVLFTSPFWYFSYLFLVNSYFRKRNPAVIFAFATCPFPMYLSENFYPDYFTMD